MDELDRLDALAANAEAVMLANELNRAQYSSDTEDSDEYSASFGE